MINKTKFIIKDIYSYFKSPKIYNPIIPYFPKSILFICKGNICRSPFAEHMARKIALERDIKHVTFYSAGLEVKNSLASPIEVLTVSEMFGCNLNAHKSRSIARSMAESYDMIIAMEAWHVKFLREIFPNLQEKMYLLSLFDKNNKLRLCSYHRNNITDPYGKSVLHYYECFQRIERCLDELLSKIQVAKKNDISNKNLLSGL